MVMVLLIFAFAITDPGRWVSCRLVIIFPFIYLKADATVHSIIRCPSPPFFPLA